MATLAVTNSVVRPVRPRMRKKIVMGEDALQKALTRRGERLGCPRDDVEFGDFDRAALRANRATSPAARNRHR